MYRVESLPISIPIGRQGENHAMKIEIDCSSFLAEWPQATITAMLRRSVAENPYVLVTSIDSNGILTWEPTAHDTGIEGDGQIEIRAVENDVLAKSVTAIVCVERSLTPPEPDTPIDWVEDIKSDIAQSVTSAANSASDAAKSAASAQESAAAAAGSAAAAQSSANAAAGSASAASKSAASAATSADVASGSASAAAQSAAEADTSAKAAAASAAEAAGTLDSVKASADAAAGSARAAAESASDAAGSKSSAAQAATAAAGSASAASKSASDAAKSAAAASGSAAAAAESKTGAESAASTAKSEADKAAASAAAADTSAQAAAGSAAAAAESAQGAAEAAKVEAAKIIQDGEIARTSTWSSQKIVDQLYSEVTASGNPAVIENALEGYPMSIKASWEPIQEGEGEPYPAGGSKNVLNLDTWVDKTVYGITFKRMGNGIHVSGTATGNATSTTISMQNLEPGKYYGWQSIAGLTQQLVIKPAAGSTNLWQEIDDKKYATVAEDDEGRYWYLNVIEGTTVDYTIYPQVYKSDTAPTQFWPYSNIRPIKGRESVKVTRKNETQEDGKTLTLPTTIYGGEVDAVTGVGTKQWEHIASYAGESLPGEWISDRDAYADGAQPTIGAQVAYKLATPESFTATGGGRIDALAGTNIILTDADSVEVKTRAVPTGIIDDTVIAEGKAWSSKNTVDKLLPMQTITGNPAGIETLEGYPLELSASWGPKQEGSGTPSPDNVRPITGGRDSVKITVNGTEHTLALPDTIYGGEVDAVTGAGVKAMGCIQFTGTETWGEYLAGTTKSYITTVVTNAPAAPTLPAVSSHFEWQVYAYAEKNSEGKFAFQSNGAKICFCTTQTYKTKDEWATYLAAQYAAGTPVQVVYKLATPETFAATGGGRIDALAGTNTISTDADTVTITAPTPPQTTASAAEAQAAKLDYVAMMADVDMDDLTAADDADADSGIDMPTDIEGSETDGKQEV